MSDNSISGELGFKLNYLLENKEIDHDFYNIMIRLVNSGGIESARRIINPMYSNLRIKEKNNIINQNKDDSLSKEIIKSNEMAILLAKENEYLKELIEINRHELESSLSKVKEKEKENKTLTDENKELKEKTQQSRIDKNISTYVDSVKDKLNSDDDFFIKMSHIWSSCGALFCMGAIAAAFCTFISGIDTLLKNEGLNSITLFYLFTRGLLGIGLLSWLSYICFNNSRKYTHESIRRKDRQHALMFGQIFLQIFGGTASKEDAIHVFKDWNMSGDTAFSGKTEQPPSIHALLAQLKSMLPAKSDKAGESIKKEDDN
ncbi:hypothetical protein ACIPTZ_05025 [Pectobacterium sp. CHL-2024]|uniref:hypothetical protein n=1 Tax=Pectobacterium TaxID=122277 RepID=UPI000ABE6546|nr:hypothetical protein [Pectobacterium brasiliense]